MTTGRTLSSLQSFAPRVGLATCNEIAVKTVQQLSARQSKLDEQLTKVRGEALKDVAVTAAKAPGDNRLAQAKQIEAVIASTKEINELVKSARKETDEKFEAARGLFAQSRSTLAELRSQ